MTKRKEKDFRSRYKVEARTSMISKRQAVIKNTTLIFLVGSMAYKSPSLIFSLFSLPVSCPIVMLRPIGATKMCTNLLYGI